MGQIAQPFPPVQRAVQQTAPAVQQTAPATGFAAMAAPSAARPAATGFAAMAAPSAARPAATGFASMASPQFAQGAAGGKGGQALPSPQGMGQMGPQMGIPSIPYSGINDPRFQQASNDFEKSLASARVAQQNMPPSPQGMGQALPTTGTFTSPNGTVLNTNPANNAFMAGAANAAKTGYNGLTGNDAAQAWMKANPMGSASLPTTAPSPQGGKGGQALPSPQALGQGLQQQQAMQGVLQAGKGGQQMPQPNAPRLGQMPMSMQRQPQGGLGGRSMPQLIALR